ncbi:MAG: cell envelope integrity EipB family protein [Ahrensia sp.]
MNHPTSKTLKPVYGVGLAMATLFVSGAASFAAPIALAPHRAVYDVALKDATDRSGITSMNGRIVYEFRGSACEGYTTNFRFVTQVGVQGEARVTDQRTSTFEEADGSLFQFVTKTYVNDAFDREVSGVATVDDDAVSVDLKKPEEMQLELSPAMFPSAHMIDLLSRAENGETFYEQALFDGSEDGDSAMATTVIIGPQKTDEEQADILGALAQEPFRTVNIAYFSQENAEGGEALPQYGIGFKMYNNGITRSLEMDYGEFSLTGDLTALEVFEAEGC